MLARDPQCAPIKVSAMKARTAAREQSSRDRIEQPTVRGQAPVHLEGLEQYLGEVQHVPLLTRDEEWTLAREIEELEIERWRALLSYRPALESLAETVKRELPEAAPKLAALSGAARAGRETARWKRTVDAVAAELRALDTDRTALRRIGAEVTAAWADLPAARTYLCRIEAARRAHERAKERFVTANLRLVVSMSRRFANAALLPRADLIQEGNLGLMRAVERFDYRRQLRFSTYASWWIRHYLNRAIADKARLVRVPVHALETVARVQRAVRSHVAKTGDAPNEGELVELTGLPEEVVAQFHSASFMQAPRSLDRQLHDDGEQTLHDVIPDPENGDAEGMALRDDQARALTRAMRVLTPFEAAIVRFRFGFENDEELTLREVGEKYNLSRERIRQVQEVALEKLRVALDRETVAA